MARNFNGTSDNINFAAPPITSAFTFSFWLKGASQPTTINVTQPLMNGTNNNFGFSWNHTISSFEQAAFVQNGSASFFAAKLTTSLAASIWYHVVGRWDGSNITAWLNGALQATTATSGSLASAGSSGLYLGCGLTPSPDNFFNGQIANFGLWPVALDAAQIGLLSTGIPAFAIPGSVLSLPLSALSPNELDWSGRGSHGTLNGTSYTDGPLVTGPSGLFIPKVVISAGTAKLRRNSSLSGLGASGPFFHDPLAV